MEDKEEFRYVYENNRKTLYVTSEERDYLKSCVGNGPDRLLDTYNGGSIDFQNLLKQYRREKRLKKLLGE